jgi:hypothetical protein
MNASILGADVHLIVPGLERDRRHGSMVDQPLASSVL